MTEHFLTKKSNAILEYFKLKNRLKLTETEILALRNRRYLYLKHLKEMRDENGN